MGDAFNPLANDPASGLFYNPAGIGAIRKFTLEPLNFALGPNHDLIQVTDFTDGTMIRSSNLGFLKGKLREKPGAFPGAMVQLLPAVGFRGFAAGFIYKRSLMASFQNEQIRYRTIYYVGPAVGFGARLFSGIIKVGYSLHVLSKSEADNTVGYLENPGFTVNNKEGSGLSHNLGFQFTFPTAFLPTLSYVVRNVGGTNYGGQSIYPIAEPRAGPPDREPMSVDASFMLRPRVKGGVFMNTVFQLRDIFNSSAISVKTRFSMGMELDIRETIFLRWGFGSGYPSAGLGIKRRNGELGFSWYSEELGVRFHQERDSRYLLQYQYRFF